MQKRLENIMKVEEVIYPIILEKVEKYKHNLIDLT